MRGELRLLIQKLTQGLKLKAIKKNDKEHI
jgi:hypothetical protein